MIILVALDLNSKTRDYTPLYDYLKSHKGWMHYIKSTWLIDTEKTPDDVAASIKSLTDNQPAGGDLYIVAQLNDLPAAWLPKDAADWISKRQFVRK
jgi:hypothetical protein